MVSGALELIWSYADNFKLTNNTLTLNYSNLSNYIKSCQLFPFHSFFHCGTNCIISVRHSLSVQLLVSRSNSKEVELKNEIEIVVDDLVTVERETVGWHRTADAELLISCLCCCSCFNHLSLLLTTIIVVSASVSA